MNRLRFILFVSVILFSFCTVAEAKSRISEASYKTYNCVIDGIERSYKLYLPANIKPNAPLVFVLHGYGGSFNLDHVGLNGAADKFGFAVCYPQGQKMAEENRVGMWDTLFKPI